jgi:Concanavalin A-like lectin/glucanases superfamily
MTGALLVLAAACSGQAQPTGGGGATRPSVASASPTTSEATSVSASSPTRRWTFDTDSAGSLPPGAQAFSGQWAVRAEPDAPSPPNALCQTGNADYPSIGLDNSTRADLTLVARFKPISGKQDQAGGLVFRVQDKDNYYILRANALEDNVILFTYVGAQRSQLKAGDAKVMSGTWHELRVEVAGTTFRGFLDGKQVVESGNDRFKSGGVGLWTKSDSVTCFDDVEVTPF